MESAFRDIPDLKIIETFRFGEGKFHRLDRHLARAERTCKALGFVFSKPKVTEALDQVENGDHRVRLTIARDGEVSVTTAPLQSLPADTVWRLAISPTRLDPAAEHLRFKTTSRETYDQARADLPSGIDEVVFANARGEVCEGAITNIFADFGQGLVTPPVTCGLLPGVLREELLASGECLEAVIPLARLQEATRLFVGNSLRGLIPATLCP